MWCRIRQRSESVAWIEWLGTSNLVRTVDVDDIFGSCRCVGEVIASCRSFGTFIHDIALLPLYFISIETMSLSANDIRPSQRYTLALFLESTHEEQCYCIKNGFIMEHFIRMGCCNKVSAFHLVHALRAA